MQDTIFYVAAGETLGAVLDYANAETASPMTLVRGVSACLKMRLFARVIQTAKGFLVYKGASMNKACKYEPAKELRETFKSKFDNWSTIEDIEFGSPSAAGKFLLGYSVNGRNVWKNAEGKAISELE